MGAFWSCAGDTGLTETVLDPALLELPVQWGRQTDPQIVSAQSGQDRNGEDTGRMVKPGMGEALRAFPNISPYP